MKFATFTGFDGKRTIKVSPVVGISLSDSVDYPGGTIITLPSMAYVVLESIEIVEARLKEVHSA